MVCLVRKRRLQSEIIGHDLLRRVRIIRGDIRDQAQLESILREHSIATLFHLAAQAIVGVANANPAATLDINIAGTIALLEACRRSPGVKQIIVASSDKAYGDAGEQAYNEDMPLRGKHPYDVSKACSDMIVRSYAATFELPAIITRCGNFLVPAISIGIVWYPAQFDRSAKGCGRLSAQMGSTSETTFTWMPPTPISCSRKNFPISQSWVVKPSTSRTRRP